MAWIVLVVLLGLAVGLLIIRYDLRKSIFIVLAVAVVGIGIVIWYAETHDRLRAGVLPVDAVRLDNFVILPAYGDSYKLKGRLVNNSNEHTLAELKITVTASDCKTDKSCMVIGEQIKTLRIVVPPQQARDVVEQFFFQKLRPRGELIWQYQIADTKVQR